MRGCFQLHVTSGPHMRPEPEAYMLSRSRVRSGPPGTHPTQESWRSLWECPDFALGQSPVVSMTRLRQPKMGISPLVPPLGRKTFPTRPLQTSHVSH